MLKVPGYFSCEANRAPTPGEVVGRFLQSPVRTGNAVRLSEEDGHGGRSVSSRYLSRLRGHNRIGFPHLSMKPWVWKSSLVTY